MKGSPNGRSWKDFVVVITGASSGIGRATALRFAGRGAGVVLCARDEAALKSVAAECEKAGGCPLVVAADVSDPDSMVHVAESAGRTYGHIDAWINNAGVSIVAPLEQAPWDLYRRVFETNLFGCIHGARAALPWFRKAGKGVLVNVGSVNSRFGTPYTSAYVATKWALRGLGESLRQDLRRTGIDVVTVMPASIDTPFFQHAANFVGRAIKPPSPVYPPEKVAAAIERCVVRPRREVVVGASGRFESWFHDLAPALFERLAARSTERDHFQDKPREPSEGNLRSPREPHTVTGGWRPPRVSRRALLAAASAVPAAALAVRKGVQAALR